MGVFLILLILTVAGIWLGVKGEFEWWGDISTIVAIISIIVLIILTPIAIIENACADKLYADLVEERELIEYRLEQIGNDKNLMVNGGTYEDLSDYNSTIRSYKTYSNNFWIGWLYANKIAKLDYISLPKGVS